MFEILFAMNLRREWSPLVEVEKGGKMDENENPRIIHEPTILIIEYLEDWIVVWCVMVNGQSIKITHFCLRATLFLIFHHCINLS